MAADPAATDRAACFEALYAHDPDPWGYRRRWYEERKRALTLASLPAARYASAFEPACAIGELSAGLAARCDRLLVCDGVAAALASARRRLGGLEHVRIEQAWMPQDWPDGRFDLVVLGEFLYYLEPAVLDTLAAKARASLADGGTVLACHWRHPIAGGELDGDAAHRRLAAGLHLPRLGGVLDADLRIDVWCADARSVAQREGLVAATPEDRAT